VRPGGLAALALVLIALAACAHKQEALFVVLPNPDGSSGAVTIQNGAAPVLLDKPYAAGEVRGGKPAPVPVTEQQVQATFGPALAARPILPAHFRLYFVSDSDILTKESLATYQAVFADLKQRKAYEVEVVGHTDTLGDKSYNQALSLRRAEAIRARLARDGLDAAPIAVAGRGPLNLAVKTADQVSEPKNRRVEITVR
jgi:outer membrane protein OmpA-like peptidoglycan-associated protein